MSSSSATRESHPLTQIACSPTHKLLLKQWLKESDLITHRISTKETRMDNTRKEITALHCSFFIFHSIILLLLFSSSHSSSSCSKFWIPCVCSFLISISMLWAVRYKTDTELHLEKLIQREKEDEMLLVKCVEELKRKGVDFDLLKEVDALRRAKSLRVGDSGKEVVKRWSGRDLGLVVLFAAACSVLGLIRVVLCT